MLELAPALRNNRCSSPYITFRPAGTIFHTGAGPVKHRTPCFTCRLSLASESGIPLVLLAAHSLQTEQLGGGVLEDLGPDLVLQPQFREGAEPLLGVIRGKSVPNSTLSCR